ncbi:hypothetical protein [Aquabacterium sp.]|uniref:SCO family protein n=1 Tax=Aquabacterium sp. TaxID=1872578 RepID=UPI001984BF0F|nr:hypothetical protein [Aquabacterium sp.]MBC7702259.1 hypothetical protein [Aquabacterium sp.]
MSGSNSSAPSAAERGDPLVQMSVHSLPSAPQAELSQRTRLGRLKMLLVWAICTTPVVASYLTYYVIRPEGRANYGTLILPTHDMPADAALPLKDLQNQPLAVSSLKGQWLLVTVAAGACDAACEQHLYYQRQVRETLGRDKDRVDRVWLITDGAPVRDALKPGLEGTTVLRTSQGDLAKWLSPEAGQPLSAHFYLVDPKGTWMMRFPAQPDMSKVKRDLSRLMKANDSWDDAGR